MQDLGLQVLYKEDDEFRCSVNSMIALAFVVSLFKSEQGATEVTLMQVAAGGLPVRKKRGSIETTKGDS